MEFKRAAYFTKLKQEGPAAVAFMDFIVGRQKERQADEAAEVKKTEAKEAEKAPVKGNGV